jgi:chromate reductase, NAD(P)H dehydrogenase (quinone)
VVSGQHSRKKRRFAVAEKFRILGFAGSLRQASFNRALLREALELLPEGVEMEIFDLEGISPFNQDLEGDPPPRVNEFKAKLRAADAILIATPEYNYSVPGVLKNAIDWASRPYGDSAWESVNTAAIMGASIGMLGTARAQYHLRQTLVFFDIHVINRPEIMITFAGTKFDEKGRLTDETARDKIRELMVNLVLFSKRLEGL